MKFDCNVCLDKGFVRSGGDVVPCPSCNPDSGWEPGEYEKFVYQKRAESSHEGK